MQQRFVQCSSMISSLTLTNLPEYRPAVEVPIYCTLSWQDIQYIDWRPSHCFRRMTTTVRSRLQHNQTAGAGKTNYEILDHYDIIKNDEQPTCSFGNGLYDKLMGRWIMGSYDDDHLSRI